MERNIRMKDCIERHFGKGFLVEQLLNIHSNRIFFAEVHEIF